MLKSYFKLAYRALLKNKVATGINLFGLSITLGCGILAYLFVFSELQRDTFHEKADRIFLVEHTADVNGVIETWGKSPAPLGPALRDEQALVNDAVRVAEAQVLVITEDFHFSEFARFVDPSFLSMFSFPMQAGNEDALHAADGIVITPEMAAKYFPTGEAFGQLLYLSIDGAPEQAFTVRGVVEKLPPNTSLGFSLLLPINVLEKADTDFNSWTNLVRATFVELATPAVGASVTPSLKTYAAAQQSAAPLEHQIQQFYLKNLKDISHNKTDVKYTIAYQVNWGPIIVLSTITLFLFLLACFNYMNITLGAMHTRMQEIGIRKVMGGQQRQLIFQFLSENILLCSLALVIGVLVARSFLIPGFTYITNGLDLSFNLLTRPDLWIYLGCLVVALGFVSGLYPAFYISAFKPVTIFSGRLQMGGPKRIMLTLLGLQFVLALITMVVSVGLTLNKNYLQHTDWGYDNADTIVLHTGPESYGTMLQAASALPGVTAVAGANNHIGAYPLHEVNLQLTETSHTAFEFEVAPTYFDVVRPKLIAGTYPAGPADVVINASMAELLGTYTAVDQLVVLDSTSYRVAGVVQDFYFQNFSHAIEPAYLRTTDSDGFIFLAVRTQPKATQAITNQLSAIWRENFPETTFSSFYQDQAFAGYFAESGRINNIFYFAALFALILSCAGLFGLAAQQVSSRMKEMSIRKILGASVGQIVKLTNRRFAVLLMIAGVLAAPVGFVILKLMLDQFALEHMPLGPAPFMIAFGLVVLLAGLTLLSQVFRLSKANPADLLRNV
ncbi:MAG: ABC transporter permease [Bacteroidota bacterium]